MLITSQLLTYVQMPKADLQLAVLPVPHPASVKMTYPAIDLRSAHSTPMAHVHVTYAEMFSHEHVSFTRPTVLRLQSYCVISFIEYHTGNRNSAMNLQDLHNCAVCRMQQVVVIRNSL